MPCFADSLWYPALYLFKYIMTLSVIGFIVMFRWNCDVRLAAHL
jgi:hypothetical protein